MSTDAISRELLEHVRDLSPITGVIAEHVRLRPAGVQFIGRCPFHVDQTPSFSVHLGKGVFCCHSCGRGGDVFSFVQIILKCSFAQAVRHLAQRAGIAIVSGFIPSRELTVKVAAAQAKREEDLAFQRFCDERIRSVSARCRDLGRAATHAEDCLMAGERDPYIRDMAWAALERFKSFEALVEREGLLDVRVIQNQWQARRGDRNVAA